MGPEDSSEDVYIGSIDQGTTSTRFVIFNKAGEVVASHQTEFRQIYPQSGWHEHDPQEILSSVQTCITRAVTKFTSSGQRSPSSIAAIGITTQRETSIVWDARTGRPLHNALVWTDTRTASLARSLKTRPNAAHVHATTGLPISTYPSATKLLWLRQNVAAVREAEARGTLCFGTVDTWLVYALNGGVESEVRTPVHGGREVRGVFVTDSTNASRTGFMALDTLSYSPDPLDFFGVDPARLALPRIVPSNHPRAYGAVAEGVLKGVRITGVLGDQSAALVGHGCFERGRAKNTYGTGCFVLCNVGGRAVRSGEGLLGTVAYDFSAPRDGDGGDGDGGGADDGGREGREREGLAYALEGSVAAAGSSVKFLSTNLGFAESPEGVSRLAGDVDDSGGVVFVTAFSGLFAPYWIDDARGTLFGLTQYTTKAHIARATLEATCFQTRAILSAMERDSGSPLTELAVDGGMSESDLCMQLQADIAQLPLTRPAMRETTSLGAAIAAGIGVGVYRDIKEAEKAVGGSGDGTRFKPVLGQEEAEKGWERWERAVQMARGWLGGGERKKDEDKGKGKDQDGD